ncbi:type I-E CRISPR-associated protein Cas6/Cse3/CasE [Gordonia sp. FQ]|uniref:type I-E CRISPR-associated protein Cas6/Cse3/CasE n=1 Tax=Gordonia sp. FQ TaxID=3446634 RepID=UPI003F86B892
MPPTDVHVTLSGPLLRSLERDRQLGHSHVMSTVSLELGPAPRHEAGVLWHIDREGERLVVRYPQVPAGATNLGVITEIREVVGTGHLRIELAMNVQKTPPTRIPPDLQAELKAASGKAFRSKLVVVPEHERPGWAARRLLRSAGFAVDAGSLSISPKYRADLGPRRGGAIPYVEITATGIPADQEKFNAALANGIGKGKNFGLGLIQTFPIEH